MTSERAVEPPAPREDGWEELRREIEALPPWSLGYLPPVFTPPVLVDRAAVLAIVDRLAAARGEPDEEPHGAALIPAGEPCPICGPKGHGGHEDDSYGACVLCREYVPHTDDLTVLVAWPCAPARLAAARGEPPEPAFTQNPDVPWRDETLHYPAAARGEPGLDAHTYRMPDGRLHCRCVEPGLLGERMARQAFDWVMEHEVEPWASGPVLASHGATFARKFAALATPTTPEPDQ